MRFLRLAALFFFFLLLAMLRAQSMTFVQQATCNPSGATCTLSGFGFNPAAGDLYIFGLINRDTNGAGFFLTGTQIGGTFTIAPGCSGSFGGGSNYYVGSCYYILPSTSTGYTTTTPTVSLNVTGIGTTSYILVQEWHPSASGSTVALDNDGALTRLAHGERPFLHRVGHRDCDFRDGICWYQLPDHELGRLSLQYPSLSNRRDGRRRADWCSIVCDSRIHVIGIGRRGNERCCL